MKRLSALLLLGWSAAAQLPYPTIPNSSGEVFRSRVNSNFSYLANSPVNVLYYGADPYGVTDSATAVLAALAAAPANGDVYFPCDPGACTYRVGSLGTLSKAVHMNFGGSTIKVDTTGTWVTLNAIPGRAFIFENGRFTQQSGVTPTDIFRVDGAVNSTFRALDFHSSAASHALIYNKVGYGTTIDTVHVAFSTAASAFYFDYTTGGGDEYTWAGRVINSDISNHTGKGITFAGGQLAVQNTVIESCTLGGFEHVGNFYAQTLNFDGIYMEANQTFNFKFPTSSIWSIVTIRNSYFFNNPSSAIAILGKNTLLTYDNNYSTSACFDGDAANITGFVSITGNSLNENTGSGCAAGTWFKSTLTGLASYAENKKTGLTAPLINAGGGLIQHQMTGQDTALTIQGSAHQITSGANLVNFKDYAGNLNSFFDLNGEFVYNGAGAYIKSSADDVVLGSLSGARKNGLNLGSGAWTCWASTSSALSGSKDTCLYRNAAGVVEINSGTAGTYRDAIARSYRLNPNADARPTCDSTQRGKLWQTYGAAGVADTVAVCGKDVADAYDWRTIY